MPSAISVHESEGDFVTRVKHIFFSTNETFALLLTYTEAALVSIGPEEIKFVSKFDLPPTAIIDGEEPHWVGAVNNTGTRIGLHCTSDFKVSIKQVTLEKPSGELIKSKIKLFKNPIWF